MTRALQRQQTPAISNARSLRMALPIPAAPKATKTPSNGPVSNLTAAVPAPVPNNSNPLPLCFSLTGAIGEQEPAAPKSAAPGSPQAAVSGVEAKDENPERLQVEPQPAFTARIKPIDDVAAGFPTASKNDAGPLNPGKADVGPPALATADASMFTMATSSTAAPLHAPLTLTHAGTEGVQSVSASQPVVETAPVQPSSHPEPLHNLSFQLPGARGVEVRLSDQGGEIRVDVRSGDPVLTQNLRGNLHDLVTGLEHKGFTAEVSHAGGASSGSNADSNSAKQQAADDHGGSGRRQRDPEDTEQSSDDRSPRTRAAWNDALNANLDPSLETRQP